MSHIELPAELRAPLVNDPPPDSGALAPFVHVVDFVNRCMLTVGMIGFFAASCVLTYSVGSRYFFKAGTDWQDEAAVFCLLGATFFCGAYVQSQRGHIGIEAVASILPAGVNRVRRAVVDVFALAFCAFFAWKSWTLWYEAVVDHQTTSSTWAPPLWIPYGVMSFGMTLLCVQLALQVASHFIRGARGLAR